MWKNYCLESFFFFFYTIHLFFAVLMKESCIVFIWLYGIWLFYLILWAYTILKGK